MLYEILSLVSPNIPDTKTLTLSEGYNDILLLIETQIPWLLFNIQSLKFSEPYCNSLLFCLAKIDPVIIWSTFGPLDMLKIDIATRLPFEVTKLFFPLPIERCRIKERPCPVPVGQFGLTLIGCFFGLSLLPVVVFCTLHCLL